MNDMNELDRFIGNRSYGRGGNQEVEALRARVAELEATLESARVALAFYRRWMLEKSGKEMTTYPFGREVEDEIRALLKKEG